MPLLILTRGLPASGKSTWAKEQVAANPDSVVRVNRDDLRTELYPDVSVNDYYNRTPRKVRNEREEEVTKVQYARVQEALKSGKNVIVDDANLSPVALNSWHRAAKAHAGKVQLHFKDFNTPVDECIRRDKARKDNGDRGVGKGVIENFARKSLNARGVLRPVPPTLREPIRTPPAYEDRPNAVIFDMDGTLCDVRPVRRYVRSENSKERNFHAFHVESEYCPPNLHVLNMSKEVTDAGLKTVIVTARDDKYRPLTERWLKKHGVDYDHIVTRPSGDHRPDYDVKREILRDVSQHYNVVHAVDDNPAVLRLWKEEGISTTIVPGFDDPLHSEDELMDVKPYPIDNPISSGRCLKCMRKMKRAGVLGPECEKQG